MSHSSRVRALHARAGGAIGLGVGAVLVSLTASPPAAAHGGKWSADQIFVEPGNSAHLVLRADAWGVTETRDAGKTWQWLCAEAYDGVSLSIDHQSMALLKGGDLLVANQFDGLWRSRGSLCDFGAVPFFSAPDLCAGKRCIVSDVTRSPGTVLVLANWGDATGYRSRLWRSTDEGATWTALPDTLPTDVAATNALAAPSDPSRLYVTGSFPQNPAAFALLVSSDTGATWTKTSVPFDTSLVQNGDPSPVLRPYAIAPAAPNTVFLWLDLADIPAPVRKGPDRALVSTDGGVTVTEIFDGHDNLEGFALSPDAKTVLMGSYADGLWSAPVADLVTRAKSAFHQVNTMTTFALLWQPDGLIAGHDDFGAPPSPRYALGVSHDEGVTFEPTMTVCDLTLMSCAAGTTAGDQCPAWWNGANFVFDFVTPVCPLMPPGKTDGGAAGTGSVDAGRRPPVATATHGAGCACGVAGASGGRARDARAAGVFLVAVFAGFGRRRRTRPRLARPASR